MQRGLQLDIVVVWWLSSLNLSAKHVNRVVLFYRTAQFFDQSDDMRMRKQLLQPFCFCCKLINGPQVRLTQGVLKARPAGSSRAASGHLTSKRVLTCLDAGTRCDKRKGLQDAAQTSPPKYS